MNHSTYFRELVTGIESNVNLSTLPDIKTATETTSTDIAILSACVDQVNHHVEVDTNAINGVTMAVGAGDLNSGTQRICIASDDNLTGTIAIQTGRVSACVDTLNNLLKIDNQRVAGNVVDVNSGTLSSGTQRMCIATNDVVSSNLVTLGGAVSSSKMNNNISSIAGTTVSVNSGTKDNGCVRFCGATDDPVFTRLSTLPNSQVTYATNSKSITMGTRDTSDAQQCPIGVGLARQDGVSSAVVGWNAFITSGSGNIADVPTFSGGDAKDAYGCPRVCIATDDVNMAAIKSDLDTIKNILTDIWNSTNHYIRTHETA